MAKLTKEQVQDEAKQMFGMLPNLIKEMSDAPAAAKTYLEGNKALAAGGFFNEKERNAIFVAVSARNDCHYCVAAHRTLGKQAGISPADLDALDAGKAPSDDRLALLAKTAWKLMDNKGRLTPDELRDLESKGLTRGHVFEIIAIIGLKTISNWVNHVAGTEIDEPFRGEATREHKQKKAG